MKKLTIDFINKEFEKEGYVLLSDKYINSKIKLEYICPEGHQHAISWSNWRSGYRCGVCGNIRGGKKRGISFEFVKSQFDKEGFILLSDEYKGPHEKLKYLCDKGHLCNTAWSKWYYSNQKCPFCSKRPPIIFDDIKASFEDEGYILLSKEYINRVPLEFICPNGHVGRITWDNWKYNNRRCCKCSNNVSKFELEVGSFVKDLGIDFVCNDRTQILNEETGCNLELDIWIPSKNKAIECNGVYWHSVEDRVNLDKLKKNLCLENGIDLFVLLDKDWYSSMDKYKLEIKLFLGVL